MSSAAVAMTIGVHVKCTAVSTTGYDVTPAGSRPLLASALHFATRIATLQPSKEQR
jgi:hypothetical protein